MQEFNIFKNDTATENPNEDKSVKAVLVSAVFQNEDKHDAEVSLNELEQLLDTAGGVCAAKLVQYKTTADARTYIGSGKVQELKELCEKTDSTLVVFDTELSPSQIRNLENDINGDDGEVRVIDRSMLILDIFALHAETGEGKLQVELAILKYTVPRLTGKGLQLSRLGGGIGTRGPGETKLESDRRHLKRRMDALQEELEVLDKNRTTQRKQRDKSGIYKIAIAGYTNAGKSTLLNYLTDANILAENKLFATLDPTTRKFALPNGQEVLLTDTVGFIRNLPHHLIKAFKSTLDEVSYSDAVLVIIDASESECHEQLKVTEQLLSELGAGDRPILYVYNKCDKESDTLPIVKKEARPEDIFYISAKTGQGVDSLISRIEQLVDQSKTKEVFFFPMNNQGQTGILYKSATIVDTEYTEHGVKITAVVDSKTKGMLAKYIV